MSGTRGSSVFEPSGFFVLRTPLLAFDELLAWAGAADPEAWLDGLAIRREIREALWLASPTLVNALASTSRLPAAKARSKLAAYLTRACARATPFGLFAGCSVGEVGEATRLELAPRDTYRRHTRLDNDYLFALVAALEADHDLRRVLTWRPNSSLYRAGGRLRYAEARLTGTLRSYHLVGVDDSDYLSATLERAAGGARVDDLATPLVDDEISLEDARAFVEELIDSQLLVSDLELQVTGAEPLHTLIARLAARDETQGWAISLDQARVALDKLDAAVPGANAADYQAVDKLLEGLPVSAEPARLLQVDMIKPVRGATLGRAVVAELARAIDVLHGLSRPLRPEAPLARFRELFVERYEEREVALAEALDEEIGVGLGWESLADESPLLDGMSFPPPIEQPGPWAPRDELLLSKVVEAARDGRHEINLDLADLEALASPDPPPLPDTLEVMASLTAASVDAVDRGEFRLLVHGISGAPGARLLGRFCHADHAIHQGVLDHLRREEALYPGVVFAEVVHLPAGRLGNILCRPVLRGHEIPYLGRSGAPEDAQIPVSDLLVSVRAGRIVLRSQRLGREVVPRLTTAHNYSLGNLGLYHFLCSMQNQGRAETLGWTWGPLASAPFLPRVTCGRLILARAQWTLRDGELTQLPRHRLPRFVALADGDNELVCDLDNPASVAALAAQLKGHTVAKLVEMLPGPDQLCVTGPEGRYVHELVVPFVRAGAPTPSQVEMTPPATVRRSFPPGSEWVYAKLYTGVATADHVLVALVRPVVNEALTRGLADSWFFLRYGDPHWHLRLRLHGEPGGILPLLHDAATPLLADGRLTRVQLDSYERELERYGGDAGIELAEQLFRHDSDAALAIIEMLAGDEGGDARWRLVLAGIDLLLDDLGLTLSEKVEWVTARRDGFAREFRADGQLRGQLGRRHRTQRDALEQLLAVVDDTNHPLWPGLAILRRRSGAVAAIGDQLRGHGLSVPELSASYAHMHANRLLRSAHRAQELVIYDLLSRLYQTRLHREPR